MDPDTPTTSHFSDRRGVVVSVKKSEVIITVGVQHPTLVQMVDAKLTNLTLLRKAVLGRGSQYVTSIDTTLDPVDFLAVNDPVQVKVKQNGNKKWRVSNIRLMTNNCRPGHYGLALQYLDHQRPQTWPVPQPCSHIPAHYCGDLVLFFINLLHRWSRLSVQVVFRILQLDNSSTCATACSYCKDAQTVHSFVCSVPHYFAIDDHGRVSMHEGFSEDAIKDAVRKRCSEMPFVDRRISLRDVRIIRRVSDTFSILDPLLKKAEVMKREGQEPGLVVALDCEGVNLGATGRLTLVQVSTMEGQVYLFDVFQCPSLIHDGRLADLLESNAVLKVIHDCRQDVAALFHQHGITLTNIFDTSIAYMVLQDQCQMARDKTRPRIGFKDLCELVGEEPVVHKTKSFLKRMRYTPNFWARRPLQHDMIMYAASDVYLLVPNIYSALDRLIHPNWKHAFKTLCEEAILKQTSDFK